VRRMPSYPPFNCKECGIETARRAPVQKYCLPCSDKRDIMRKTKWAKEHPQKVDPVKLAARREAKDARVRERGEIISHENRSNITWMATNEPDIQRVVRTAFPFTWGFSKNRIYSLGPKYGHVFIREEGRQLRHAVGLQIKRAMGDMKFYKGKVWLDIMVQKPDNKGDAVNVVDTICDIVKHAIGIDDRYFSIRRLDWEIVKTKPMIFIGIGQEIGSDHFVCAYCGRHLPLKRISAQRRTCLDCQHGSHFAKRHEADNTESEE
jgi:hypothetical protein